MQKTILAAALAATLGACATAQAADLNSGGSLKDAPTYLSPNTWTGFYLGAGGGGGATSSDLKAELDVRRLTAFGEANGIGGMGGSSARFRLAMTGSSISTSLSALSSTTTLTASTAS
jgi:hypothetical protein